MSRLNIEDLLDRYLAGKTTPGENQLLEQWLSDHHAGTSTWEDMNATARRVWLDRLFDDIEPGTAGKGDAPVIPLYRPGVWLRSLVAVAATITVFVGLYFLWSALRSGPGRNELAALHVSPNQTELLALADGSKIWVNTGAVLNYPRAFTEKKREVYLTGEAYFDIHHDSTKPFLVHVGKVVIAVLGTAFNIKTDPSGRGVIVTVMRGKVSVADGSRLLAFLTPDRQLRYNTLTHQAVQKNVDAGTAISWQQDSEMHFEDMTFETAVKLLEQRFSVTISFANEKLQACRFSGTIEKGKDLDEILKIMCAFNNASFHRDPKGNIIIEGKGCN